MGDVVPIREHRLMEPAADLPPHQLGRAVAHLSPVLLFVALSVVVGRPAIWLAGFVFLAPLAMWAGRISARDDALPAAVFAAVAGGMAAGGWILTRLPDLWRPFALLVPLALLLALLGLVNLILVCCSRSLRAWRGQPLNYPWIPDRLAARVGLRENGAH